MSLELSEVHGTSLHTRGAQALLIYELFRSEKANPPPASNEVVLESIGLAFEREDYTTGVKIAKQYSIDNDLAQSVIDVGDQKHGELPESAKQLPGFKEGDQFEYRKDFRQWEWLNAVRVTVANEVLVPNHKYAKAAELLTWAGWDRQAFELAEEHLDVHDIARLAKKSGSDTGFRAAISAARKFEQGDLETRLKNDHIDAVTSETCQWGRNPNRFCRAIVLTREYGLPAKKEQVRREGIEVLTKQLEQEFVQRAEQRRQYNKQRWNRRYMEPKVKDPDERRYSRYDSLGWAGDHDSLIRLAQDLPDGEKQAVAERLCNLCTENHDAFYGLAFAVELRNYERALDFGHSLTLQVSNFGGDDLTGKVRRYMQKNVLPHLNKKQAQRFIEEQSWTRDSDLSIEVAKQHKLTGWLMQSYVTRNEFYYAAKVAEDAQDKAHAREYYEKAGQFEKAANFSDDGLDQANLYFCEVARLAKTRVRCDRTPDINRDSSDVLDLMQKGYDSAGEQRGNKRFNDSALNLTKQLILSQHYTEAVLFAKFAGVSTAQYRSCLPVDCINMAETRRDFVTAYHLANALGNEDQASTYRSLAEHFRQKVPVSLKDLRPKPRVDLCSHETEEIPF